MIETCLDVCSCGDCLTGSALERSSLLISGESPESLHLSIRPSAEDDLAERDTICTVNAN
uniref:Uncharacterized protein n=1 Tax=Anguilla anguilla TaxID=7936 RepID=A0A0E9Q6R6_ANGAN